MCDHEVPCFHETPLQEFRPLTLLMLDCWQREYDKRPYRNFTLDRLQFEQRMQRLYDPVRDLVTIVEFINKRSLLSLKLVGLQIVPQTCELIQQFIVSLSNLQEIVLKYVGLPNEFFVLLESNVDKMKVKVLVLKGNLFSLLYFIFLYLY